MGHKGLNNRNSNKKLTGSSIFECKTKVGVSFGLYLSHYKRSSNSNQVPTQTQADELTDINYSVAAGLQTLLGKGWKQRTSASLVRLRRKILFSKKGGGEGERHKHYAKKRKKKNLYQVTDHDFQSSCYYTVAATFTIVLPYGKPAIFFSVLNIQFVKICSYC